MIVHFLTHHFLKLKCELISSVVLLTAFLALTLGAPANAQTEDELFGDIPEASASENSVQTDETDLLLDEENAAPPISQQHQDSTLPAEDAPASTGGTSDPRWDFSKANSTTVSVSGNSESLLQPNGTLMRAPFLVLSKSNVSTEASGNVSGTDVRTEVGFATNAGVGGGFSLIKNNNFGFQGALHIMQFRFENEYADSYVAGTSKAESGTMMRLDLQGTLGFVERMAFAVGPSFLNSSSWKDLSKSMLIGYVAQFNLLVSRHWGVNFSYSSFKKTESQGETGYTFLVRNADFQVAYYF